MKFNLLIFPFLIFLFLFDSETYIYKNSTETYDSLLYPKQKHRDQALLISRLLSKYHYKKMPFDDSLSSDILKNILSH